MREPHHSDRHGVQWYDIGETMFLNTGTGRWMKKNSIGGKRVLKKLFPQRAIERGGRIIALKNLILKGKPTLELVKQKNNNKLGVIQYKWNIRTHSPITLEKYVSAVLGKKAGLVANATDEFLSLLFRDSNNQLSAVRTINITGLDEAGVLSKISKLDRDGTLNQGSDVLQDTELIDLKSVIYKAMYPVSGGKSNTYSTYKTDLFHCESRPSKDNNCLFMLIKQFLNLTTQTRTLRAQTGIEDGLPVSVEQLRTVEDCFDIGIDVYEGGYTIKKGEVRYNFAFKSARVSKPRLELLLHDGHYYLIKKFMPIKLPENKKNEKEEKLKTKTSYIIFDFETIFELYEEHLLKPYSCAWFKITEDEFKHWSYSDEKMRDCKFHLGFDCVEKLIDDVERADEDEKIVLVGYNNSRFDDYFLLDYCNLMGKPVYPFIANGRVSLEFKGEHTTLDLCRFVMASLDSACGDDGFRTTPKKLKGFSHYEIQRKYESCPDKDDFFEYLNTTNVKEYNKIDVLATMDLFHKVRVALLQTTGLDMTDHSTLAGLSYVNWKNSLEDKDSGEAYGVPATNACVDKFFRRSLYGGRCQIFNETDSEEPKPHHMENCSDMRMVDVKSLYPYVMLNRKFPIGKEISTAVYVKDKCGIYLCEVENRGDMYNVIPYRADGESLQWNHKGRFEANLTSVDIETLWRHGHHCVVKYGYYWVNSVDDMFDCLEEIKQAKSRQDFLKKTSSPEYNPALRQIYKLLLNSLSGKVSQRNYNSKIVVVKDYNQISKLRKHWAKKRLDVEIVYERDIRGGHIVLKLIYDDNAVYRNPKPAHIGSFIYAYSRTHMYENVISKMKLWYMDTDSALIHKQDMCKIKIGDDFGDFEEEIYNVKKGKIPKTYYAIAPKFYAIFNENPLENKIRIKGINPNDKLIPKEDEELIKSLTPLELYHKYYGESVYPSAYCEDLFKRKIEGEKVLILCSHLSKRMYGVEDDDIYSAGIRQTMMIKEI